MIYQLKIALLQTRPPLWRRIHISSTASFKELHDFIQFTMNWDDNHLHIFSFSHSPKIVKTQQQQPKQSFDLFTLLSSFQPQNEKAKTYIGNSFTKDVYPFQFEESKELLANWITNEKDTFHYCYDFGEDYNFRITLEKVIEPQKDIAYPRCIKTSKQSTFEEDQY